jgi:hypothetical protein
LSPVLAWKEAARDLSIRRASAERFMPIPFARGKGEEHLARDGNDD